MSRSKLLPKGVASASPAKKTKSQKPIQLAKAKSKRNPKKTKMNDRDLLESLNEDTAARNSKLAKVRCCLSNVVLC